MILRLSVAGTPESVRRHQGVTGRAEGYELDGLQPLLAMER
jgi:hypothetical protein